MSTKKKLPEMLAAHFSLERHAKIKKRFIRYYALNSFMVKYFIKLLCVFRSVRHGLPSMSNALSTNVCWKMELWKEKSPTRVSPHAEL